MIISTQTAVLVLVYRRCLSIGALGPTRALMGHPHLPSLVTLRRHGSGLSVTLIAAQTAPRRRSEGTDRRPERTMAELHSALRVAVRCPGTVPRWPSRLIADSVPRRFAVAPFRPKMCSYRVTKTSRES